MNDEDKKLAVLLKVAQRKADGIPPPFAETLAAAERRRHARTRTQLTGVAAAIASAVVVLSLLPAQQGDYQYVDIEELAATTRWQAPSDSLLPRHQIDVYNGLPRLLDWGDLSVESPAEFDEGALL